MSNKKKGVSKIRSSAPLMTNYEKEKIQRISDKLYMPFIKDKSYKLEINNKLTRIKADSKNNAIFTNKLNKNKEEVDKLGKQLFIYNNPSKIDKYFFYFLYFLCLIFSFIKFIYNLK
jgi:hypothetical protein